MTSTISLVSVKSAVPVTAVTVEAGVRADDHRRPRLLEKPSWRLRAPDRFVKP